MNLKEIGSEGVQKIFPVQDKPLVGSCEHGNDRLDKKNAGNLTRCGTRNQETICSMKMGINPLTPNDPYWGRTAPLTSKRCILYIYSTNIGTEYFKRGI